MKKAGTHEKYWRKKPNQAPVEKAGTLKNIEEKYDQAAEEKAGILKNIHCLNNLHKYNWS